MGVFLAVIDFANIFKAFIGANYLSMPFTFMQGGLVLGIVLMFLNIVLTEHCCHLIIQGKKTMVRKILAIFDESSPEFGSNDEQRKVLERRMIEATQLGNLAEFAFGFPGRYTIEAALAFTQCGFCVIYFIFIGTVASDLFPMKDVNTTEAPPMLSEIMTNHTTTTTTTTTPIYQVSTAPDLIYLILIPFPIFWLSSMVRTIRGLGVISLVANMSILAGWIVIYYDLISGFSVSDDFKYVATDTIPVFIGMVIPTFEGIGMMMPIENGMKGNRKLFRPLLATAMYTAGLIVSSFGVLGYLRYGSETQQILIQNIPQHTALSKVVDVTLIVGVLFTYPLQNFPTIELLEKWFFAKGLGCCSKTQIIINNMNDDEQLITKESFITSVRAGSIEVLHMEDSAADLTIDASWFKRYLLRTVLVCSQLGLAILLRNLYAYVISFIGAIGSAFLAFIFPCAVQLKLEWNEISTPVKVKLITIITLGFSASIVAIVGTIISVVQQLS